MNEEDKNPGATTQDEVSLVDIFAILLRKRKVWIGVTVVCTVIALGVYAFGRVAPKFSGQKPRFVSTVKAVIHNDRNLPAPGTASISGDTAVVLGSSQACVDLVAQKLGPDAAAEYHGNVSLSFDAKTQVLSVSVVAADAANAESEARAGLDGIRKLYLGSDGGSLASIADRLESEARRLMAGSGKSGRSSSLDDAMVAAARNRADLILAEAFLANPVPGILKGDPLTAPLAQLVEELRKENVKALPGGLFGGVDQRAASTIDALAAEELLARADLIRAIAPSAPERVQFIDVATVPEVPRSMSLKSVILAFFASLFVGILAAFCANAWDRIREDPESMARLRAAWKKDDKAGGK